MYDFVRFMDVIRYSCWAGVALKAEVDKKQIITDDVVTYTCSVDLGAQEIDDFTPPSFADFSVFPLFVLLESLLRRILLKLPLSLCLL